MLKIQASSHRAAVRSAMLTEVSSGHTGVEPQSKTHCNISAFKMLIKLITVILDHIKGKLKMRKLKEVRTKKSLNCLGSISSRHYAHIQEVRAEIKTHAQLISVLMKLFAVFIITTVSKYTIHSYTSDLK